MNQQIEFAMKLFTYVCIQMTNTEHNVKKLEYVIKNLYSVITIQVEKTSAKQWSHPGYVS